MAAAAKANVMRWLMVSPFFFRASISVYIRLYRYRHRRLDAPGKADRNAMVQQTALKRDVTANLLFPYCISGLYKRVAPVP
jgi:hypothetical protein